MSTVNMTKTLVGPRARRDDPFESLRKNSSSKRDCRQKESRWKGGREGGREECKGLAGGNCVAEFSLSYLKGCHARKN